MWTLFFQQIASLGYIVIGPWAIIYNPADSYKYCFCCCLFFIARWSLLMFFGISKRPRTQGWLGEASSGLGWGEPCSRCSGGLTSSHCPWQSCLTFSNQNYVSNCHHNQWILPSRSWTQSWSWIWASFTSAATALVAMLLWSFSKKDALMSRWWWIFLWWIRREWWWWLYPEFSRVLLFFPLLTVLTPLALSPYTASPLASF